MKRLTFLILMTAFCLPGFCQTQFIVKGKIEFEKKVNMYKNMGDGIWAEQMKGKMPEFQTTYYELRFDGHQSTYKNGKETDDPWKKMWGGEQGTEDVIYNNYDSGKTISLKQVFEKNYLIVDSLIKIDWRITNDTRKIAGFECRKAVGRLFDTLYVVAFYTDEILTPGGPANYTGLPGMILGIGFPRFYTTIFATKLELAEVKPTDLAAPTKGKKTNWADMFTQVKSATKDWGKDWQKYFWQSVL